MSMGSFSHERNSAPAPNVMTFDSTALRQLMRHWPSGVTIVTAVDPTDSITYGMTVSTFTSLSLKPPLISVFLSKEARTTEAVLAAQTFGVSILAEDQGEWSNRFAGFDPIYEDYAKRFAGLTTHTAQTGAPLLSDTLGWLDCKIWAVYDGSTHHIVIGEVVDVSSTSELNERPLLYYHQGYRRLANDED